MNNIYLWDITFLVNKFLFNLEGVINLHLKILNIAEFDFPPDNLIIQYKRLKETTIEDILETTEITSILKIYLS